MQPGQRRRSAGRARRPRSASDRHQPHPQLRLAERLHQRHADRHGRRGHPARRRPTGPAGDDRGILREVARGLRRRLRRARQARRHALLQVAYKGVLPRLPAHGLHHVPLDAGDFSLIDRRVVDALKACRRTTASCAGCARGSASSRSACPYVRPERMFGVTTNNFRKNLGWARKAICRSPTRRSTSSPAGAVDRRAPRGRARRSGRRAPRRPGRAPSGLTTRSS